MSQKGNKKFFDPNVLSHAKIPKRSGIPPLVPGKTFPVSCEQGTSALFWHVFRFSNTLSGGVKITLFKSLRGFKLILSAALVVAAVSAASTQIHIHAASPATYVVTAGGGQINQPFELMAFTPQTLKVHRGDTVTWQVEGFHNVRFDVKPLPLILTSTIDGKTVQEANPAFIFPNVKSGDPFKPGANSGLPMDRGRPRSRS